MNDLFSKILQIETGLINLIVAGEKAYEFHLEYLQAIKAFAVPALGHGTVSTVEILFYIDDDAPIQDLAELAEMIETFNPVTPEEKQFQEAALQILNP